MPSEVYVDDDWNGLPNGTVVGTGKVIGTNAFATIEDGLTNVDPGGTVFVEPGLYQPDQTLLIDKSVTLFGPQANIDPRPSFLSTRTPGSGDEAIVDGANLPMSPDPAVPIFRISANDVTINGFEVRNGRTDLIDSIVSAPVKFRPNVSYNIIHQAVGDEGVQLRNINSGVIEYNYVFDTFGDAINICCGSIDSSIQYNEVRDIRSPDAAIYVYNSTNITIEGNLVENVLVNDGIKLGDADGTDVNRAVGSVIGNVVRDIEEDSISVNSSHTIVEGNDVYRSRSTNGAIYLNRNLTNIQITNNCVHDNGILGDGKITYGIRIGALNQISTDVHVNNNNIFDNIEGGLIYNPLAPQPPEPLDAENNWWGSPTGPPPVGPDSVVGFVDYVPFLTEPGPVCLSHPVIDGPGDITVQNDPGQCSALVTYTVTAESSFFPINEISCSPGESRAISPPESFVSITETIEFPVGLTTVTCSVTNIDGNTDTVEFSVRVEDQEPPEITCPTNIEKVVSAGESGAFVEYPPPVVSDNCPGVSYSCNPASGSFFPVGDTTIQCTALDASGNASECFFTINVTQYQPDLSVIRIDKVYDWVLDVRRLSESIPLIISGNASNTSVHQSLEDRRELKCTLKPLEVNGDKVQTINENTKSRCEVIGVKNGNPGVVTLRTVLYTELDITDLNTNELVDTLTYTIHFEDEVGVCIPDPLSAADVFCEVVDVKRLSGSTIISNNHIDLDFQVCREILVENEVNLEVDASICSPRSINPETDN